jgi:hypothetical protein
VKYDSQYEFNTGNIGSDDWTTNWMYDLLQDYDVDIDILTTREFEAMVTDAMAKVNGPGAPAAIEAYKTLAAIYQNYYTTMQHILKGDVDVNSSNYLYLKNKLTSTSDLFVEADLNHLFGEDAGVYAYESAKGGFHVSEEELRSYIVAQANLDSYLTKLDEVQTGIKGTAQKFVHDEIVYETTYHRYSDWYSLANEFSGVSYAITYPFQTVSATGAKTTADKAADTTMMTEFSSLYVPWRNAKIWEMYFYRMYMKYLTYASMKEYNGTYIPDLTEVYSCIVVGVGEHFGNDDLGKDEIKAIDTLKMYVENEGNTFIFHQTINDSGSTPLLTSNFRTLFGQNYNHVTTRYVTTTAISYELMTGNHWEGKGSYTPIATGTLEAGQGMDITLHCVASGWGVTIQSADVAPNSSKNVNVSWVVTDADGNPTTEYNNTNQRLKLYMNGSATEKFTFNMADHSGSSGTQASVATITESAESVTTAINESSSDTDRYHYTPLLRNNQSIATSPLHKTYFDTTGNSVNGKDNWLTYTQTGYMVSDVNVPVLHAAESSTSFDNRGATFTNIATQTNKGVVTLYPFLISSRLKISGTHPNSFSTDVENDDLVVYYALDGGTPGTQSSAAAADPKDGIDNYWLYSFGNLTYCGAGHQNVTGLHRDNNDERRLFINVILNSAKKSVFGPTVEIFDPYPLTDTVTGESMYVNNEITMTEDGIYEMTIPNTSTIPEFTFRTTIPDTKDEVAEVHIYYDLSSGTSGDNYGFVDGTDVMIYQATAEQDPSIKKDSYKLISRAIENLALQDTYFAPYGNKYTYIVVAVRTTKGIYTLQRIMIKLAPKLWDLT